jgi:hypothetical protein
MDRLTKAIGLIAINCVCILFSCAHQPTKFIYLDDVLKHYSDSSQQRSDLISFLYLKPDLMDTVNMLYPSLLTKRERETGYFLIDERDQFTVDTQKEYDSVEKVTLMKI